MDEWVEKQGPLNGNRFKALALALVSLTLGLLGWVGLVLPGLRFQSGRLEVVLFYVPAFAIPGVVFAHVAIRLAKRLGRARATGAIGFGGLVIGYSSVLIVAAVLLPQVLLRRGPDRDLARRRACKNNLKMIGLALQVYAHDHDGWFPIGPAGTDSSYALGILAYADEERAQPYLLDAAIFLCPSSDDLPGHWRLSGRGWSAERGGLRPSSTSYTYLPGYAAADHADTMLLFDDSPERHDGGRNVLFLDGRTEHVKEEEFQKRLGEQEASINEYGG